MAISLIGHGNKHVLALHGWFGTGSSWLETLSWLDPDLYTVAKPDYRGFGTRFDIPGNYDLAEISSDMLALTGETGWSSFDIIGHSMGGKAAQRILADAPGRVRRMVAITPVPPIKMPFDDATMAFFRSAAADPSIRGMIIAESTGKRHSDTFVNKLVSASIKNSRVEAFASYLESWVGDDLTARLGRPPHPVRIIVGKHDSALTAEVMRQAFMPYYLNSHLVELEGCGHYPLFESPVALATMIHEHLKD